MDIPHHQHTSHNDRNQHYHQASSTSPGSPSRLHAPGPENGNSAVRRGLKRPGQHSTTSTTRSGRERRWAKHCGCSGPCQAELFGEDDNCEDLELEALENLLKRRRTGYQGPSSRFRGACSDTSDSSRASVSSSIVESDCESQPESSSSPPQLLHFLMMF